MSESGTGDVEDWLARIERRDERLTRALEQLAQREVGLVGKPGRDWDAYAAVIASFIGLLALAVSGYTAYVQRQQLRAQVWPHLQIWESTVSDDLHLYISNLGTGPARITKVRVTVNGAAVKTWQEIRDAAGFTGEHGLVRATLGRIVLPPGKDYTIARPAENEPSRTKFSELLLDQKHAISIVICYCSVLDECWVTGFGLAKDDPIRSQEDQRLSSGDCPIRDAEQFTQ